ncbi:MAG: energy transducer TonB [Acidobacteriota bacterium]
MSDAIAAGAPPTWTEAVALVREVASLLTRGAEPLHVPRLSQISILSTGAVQISGGRAHPTGPVAGLGELMGALLEPAGVPPPLREVERQAQADPPVFTSVRALHAALEYFARPDPPGELANYYLRAAQAIDDAVKNKAFETLKERAKTAAEIERPKTAPSRSWRVYWILAATAIAATAVVLAMVRYGPQATSAVGGSADAALDALSATTEKITAATTNAVAKLIGGVPSNGSPANASPPAPPAAAAKGAARPPARTAPAPVAVPAASSPAAGDPPASVSTPTQAPPEPSPVDLVVYSTADKDVREPVLIYPQLPATPRMAAPPGERGELELLVLEDGTVAEARLIPASTRVQDAMLVSAAKAWRFEPAQRDGRPVMYRFRVPITW